MNEIIRTSTAQNIVKILKSTSMKNYADSPILKRLGDLFLIYEIGFFEEFGKYKGYGILGQILLDTNDTDTKECILSILIRAIKAEGDAVKLSILLTMTLMPIPYLFKYEENLNVLSMALEFVINMFLQFTFFKWSTEEHYLDYSTMMILKRNIMPVVATIQLPLLTEDKNISLKAAKAIGLFARLRDSRINLAINEYINEHGYKRILDHVFTKRGEALDIQEYISLTRYDERVSELLFTEQNMQRLKEAMIRTKQKHSLFFVIFKKCARNALRPHIKLICDSGIVEVLTTVVSNPEGLYSEFNRIQAMESINRLVKHFNIQQARFLINKPFFKGLNEILKKNKGARSKMSILETMQCVLRHGSHPAVKTKNGKNAFAMFARKQKIYKTLLEINGNEENSQRSLQAKAKEIISYYLTDPK